MRAVPMMWAVEAGPANGLPKPPVSSDSTPIGTVPLATAPGAAWQIACSFGP